jgi:hypothetical protein
MSGVPTPQIILTLLRESQLQRTKLGAARESNPPRTAKSNPPHDDGSTQAAKKVSGPDWLLDEIPFLNAATARADLLKILDS